MNVLKISDKLQVCEGFEKFRLRSPGRVEKLMKSQLPGVTKPSNSMLQGGRLFVWFACLSFEFCPEMSSQRNLERKIFKNEL